jgi:hypothetical protein
MLMAVNFVILSMYYCDRIRAQLIIEASVRDALHYQASLISPQVCHAPPVTTEAGLSKIHVLIPLLFARAGFFLILSDDLPATESHVRDNFV